MGRAWYREMPVPVRGKIGHPVPGQSLAGSGFQGCWYRWYRVFLPYKKDIEIPPGNLCNNNSNNIYDVGTPPVPCPVYHKGNLNISTHRAPSNHRPHPIISHRLQAPHAHASPPWNAHPEPMRFVMWLSVVLAAVRADPWARGPLRDRGVCVPLERAPLRGDELEEDPWVRGPLRAPLVNGCGFTVAASVWVFTPGAHRPAD